MAAVPRARFLVASETAGQALVSALRTRARPRSVPTFSLSPSGTGPRRRRLGIRARTVAAFGLTALVLAVSRAALAYGLVRNSLLDTRESAATRRAYTNARLVRSGLRGPEPDIPRLLRFWRRRVG